MERARIPSLLQWEASLLQQRNCQRFRTFSGMKAAKEGRLIKPSISSAAFPYGLLLCHLLQWRSQDPGCRSVQTQSLQALLMTLLSLRAGRARWCSGARGDQLLQAGHLQCQPGCFLQGRAEAKHPARLSRLALPGHSTSSLFSLQATAAPQQQEVKLLHYGFRAANC